MAIPMKKCLQWFLIISNFIFFALGTTILVLELIWLVNPGVEQTFGELKSTGRSTAQRIVSICLSAYKILVALAGLVGALLKNRQILRIYISAVIFSMLCNVVMLVLVSLSVNGVHRAAGDYLRKNFKIYGDNSTKDGAYFTKHIAEIADASSCCGWSDDDDENLYLNSIWFLHVNGHRTARPQTLPQSCCIGGDDTKIANCTRAQSMTLARSVGLAYHKTCLIVMVNQILTILYVLIAAYVFLTLLDHLSIYAAFSVIKLSENEEYGYDDESESTSGPSYDGDVSRV